MATVLRNILAVVVALVVASAIMMAVESLNGKVFHPELGEAAQGLTDPEAIRALLANAPASAFVVVAIGWLLGSFAGGWVAARLAPPASSRPPIVVGILLTLLGIANNLMLPPPAWFWILSLAVLLPPAWAGGRLGRRELAASAASAP